MYENRPVLIVITIAFFMFATACKKSNNGTIVPAIQIDEHANGKATLISQGQILKITLFSPGDGGYDFDTPQFGSSVLKLDGHIHTPPGPGAAIGYSGTDTWTFSGFRSGTTILTITATREWDKNDPVVMFRGTMTVK